MHVFWIILIISAHVSAFVCILVHLCVFWNIFANNFHSVKMASPNSSAEEVLDYLQSHCGSLVQQHGRLIFEGIDGHVLFGLTPVIIGMVLPQLSEREAGLLLARIETLKSLHKYTPSAHTGTYAHTGAHTPSEHMAEASAHRGAHTHTGAHTPSAQVEAPSAPTVDTSSAPRDVTPPAGYRRKIDYGENVLGVPIVKPFVVSTQNVVPTPTVCTQNVSLSKPLLPTATIPRILIEVWRIVGDEENIEFVGEAWLPDLRNELRTDTQKLALKRVVRVKGYVEGTAIESPTMRHSRTWFGAVVVTLRFSQIDNSLSMFIAEISDLVVFGGELFFKIFTFDTGELNLIFESPKRTPSDHISDTCVVFDQHIRVNFTSDLAAAMKPAVARPVEPRSPRIGESVELYKGIMKAGEHPIGSAQRRPAALAGLLSVYDLLLFVNRGESFQLTPRYNRFEAYLFPTHEIGAHFGSVYTLHSKSQISALASDIEYMQLQSQLVELLIASWETSWGGHSWLLRHVLLSCILLSNWDSARKVIKTAKQLGRQVDLVECGFGEAVFSLQADVGSAQKFWDQEPPGPLLKIDPLPRTTLGNLISHVTRGTL